MEFKVLYTLKAKEDLGCIDKEDAVTILKKVDFFVASGTPLKFAKKLKDFKIGTYRFRVGDYRVIFDIDNQSNVSILLILKIGHRKEIYV